LNTSILACLRDTRHLNFDDSLIGAIETSLCNGPVYFDGYPDLTISLTDKNILETLKINIKLHGYNILPGFEIIAIIHHVHYKATNSICPKSLVNLTKGETTMMKCITNDSNILIPQKIKLSDINIPEDWFIQSDTIAHNQENIENNSLHSQTQNEECLLKIRYLPGKRSKLQNLLNTPILNASSNNSPVSSPLPSVFSNTYIQSHTVDIRLNRSRYTLPIAGCTKNLGRNAHKIKNNLDKTITNLLIAGFIGQIKGWWDNVFTTQQQTEILETIQVNELKEPILDSNNETIEDAVSTLIIIAKYFVGDPTYLKDRTTDQLSNLRCRKLQDFRDIISTITKTGLEICNEIKMSKQMKRDSKTYKKELGDFCTQFGYEPFKPPPSKTENLQKHEKNKRYYDKKQFEKSECYKKSSKGRTHFKTNNFPKPTNDFQKTNFQNSNTCYNCDKPRHIARYCRIRKQIKKLDLSEDHKNQLFKIINNQNPKYIAKRVFYPEWHYYNNHVQKTQTYYEFILLDTDSIKISPKSDPKNPGLITHTSFTASFDMSIYNYFDYMDAWKHAFLFQNIEDRHSWFFCFDKTFNTKQTIPYWFVDWWCIYGPAIEIL
ncbi:LOW QUALITY PROTEIN: zf-CCHC domain-containing protein/MP domain-containing protein, partial [Cephalotus follicularis]